MKNCYNHPIEFLYCILYLKKKVKKSKQKNLNSQNFWWETVIVSLA